MAAAGGICPPEWEALLDDLCERFPFAAESHVLCMLTAAQGDAEVVAECLSEYPAARLCQPWILPGEYDACGLWRPASVLEVLDPPAKFHWIQPDIYFDQDAPPSPGRTRSGKAYGTDRVHCLQPNDTHLAPAEVQLHTQAVGVGPNGVVRRHVGKGWVPYTDAIAQVWPNAQPRTIDGELRKQRIWSCQ